MSEIDNLWRALVEAKIASVTQAFETFLDREVNIAKGVRSLASKSQNHLREFLASESDRDKTFPRVLSIVDSDFLGGSFARHTKIWPLDDIDVYLPLDGHDLFYLQNAVRLPYTVLSDGVLKNNPLLGYRWMSGPYVSSARLIHEFASVLRRHYPKETGVSPKAEAVTVRLSQGETDHQDGLGYDIVPCFSMKPDEPSELSFYLIPDGKNGWLRTNPRIDGYISEKIQADNNKTFRKVVKLIKYWVRLKLSGSLESYYAELAIAKAFLQKNREGVRISEVSYGLALGFEALSQAVQGGNEEAWIDGAPPVEPGVMNALQHLTLSHTVTSSRNAWEKELLGRKGEALHIWKRVFGEQFGA